MSHVSLHRPIPHTSEAHEADAVFHCSYTVGWASLTWLAAISWLKRIWRWGRRYIISKSAVIMCINVNFFGLIASSWTSSRCGCSRCTVIRVFIQAVRCWRRSFPVLLLKHRVSPVLFHYCCDHSNACFHNISPCAVFYNKYVRQMCHPAQHVIFICCHYFLLCSRFNSGEFQQVWTQATCSVQ